VIRGESFEPGVLYDPHDPDPSRRYKLFWWGQNTHCLFPAGTLGREYIHEDGFDVVCKDDDGSVIARRRVYPFDGDWYVDVAFSPAGIHWKRHPEPAFLGASDSGQSPYTTPASASMWLSAGFTPGASAPGPCSTPRAQNGPSCEAAMDIQKQAFGRSKRMRAFLQMDATGDLDIS